MVAITNIIQSNSDLDLKSEVYDNHLIPFYNGIIEIETGIKHGGFEILLKYCDINIEVIESMYLHSISGLHRNYFAFIDELTINTKIYEHLFSNSNILKISRFYGHLVLGFCKNQDLVEITKLSEKINFLQKQQYCWEGVFLRKDLTNNESAEIVGFLINQGLNANYFFKRKTFEKERTTPLEFFKNISNIHKILATSLVSSNNDSVIQSELPMYNLEPINNDEIKRKKLCCIII
jgi:hypothetical protein